jgi:hypothetical protein
VVVFCFFFLNNAMNFWLLPGGNPVDCDIFHFLVPDTIAPLKTTNVTCTTQWIGGGGEEGTPERRVWGKKSFVVTYLRGESNCTKFHLAANRCRWNRRRPLQCLPNGRRLRWDFRDPCRTQILRHLLQRNRRSPSDVEIDVRRYPNEFEACRRRRYRPTGHTPTKAIQIKQNSRRKINNIKKRKQKIRLLSYPCKWHFARNRKKDTFFSRPKKPNVINRATTEYNKLANHFSLGV